MLIVELYHWLSTMWYRLTSWLRWKLLVTKCILQGKYNPASLNDIQILYRNEHFVVINKRYDVRINSNESKHTVTVATQLAHLHPELVDPKLEHGFRFVHRLDYATSGVLCLALTKLGSRWASKVFEKHLASKYYLALVRGHVTPPPSSDTQKPHGWLIDIGIGEDNDARSQGAHSMCPAGSMHCEKPREARTEMYVLQHGVYEGMPASKLLLIPQTGRTHQLRVHCAALGHPIIGDYTYSRRKDTSPHRMMLHAHRLCLDMAHEHLNVTAPDLFTKDIDHEWEPQETLCDQAQIEGLSPRHCDKVDRTPVW